MKLAEAVGFPVRYQPAANEYAHGSDMFILSPDGKLSRYLGFDPPAQTLRLSLVEASEGKIATTLDRVLLWCFHFDPNANSYVVQAWRVMQVGGAVSALTLGGRAFLDVPHRAASACPAQCRRAVVQFEFDLCASFRPENARRGMNQRLHQPPRR